MILLFAVNYGYVMIDQLFLSEKVRPFALFVFVLITMIVYFIMIKPNKPFDLSRLLSLILGVIVFIIIIVTHVIITFDISYKGVVILGVTFLTPFVAGYIYKSLFIKNKN